MKKALIMVFLLLLALLFLFPVVASVTNSLMTGTEISKLYGKDSGGVISLVPSKITLNQYYELLVEKYSYIHMFWNSVMLSGIITFFHVIISILSAFVFAKVRFKAREPLFFTYIVVMMMPFQVTLLPNYIMAKRVLGIFDTYWAIILPGIFAPFGVFLLRQFMKYIPDEFLEAISLESNSVFDTLRIAIIPNVKPGIIALTVLTFAENWNMVEQPLVLLEDKLKHPLSIALNSVIEQAGNIAFAGSVVYMIPIVILFIYFEEQIVEGLGNFKF